jgi:hypothetical protein
VIGRIGDDVARELRRFGAGADLAALVEAWPRAVGDEIARNAWPGRLARDGTLHVNTSSSAWAFELQQLERRVQESLGSLAPRRLRFAPGPLPTPSEQPRTRDARVAHPSEGHVSEGVRVAAGIDDEKLRKIVANAVALGLARTDSGRLFW